MWKCHGVEDAHSTVFIIIEWSVGAQIGTSPSCRQTRLNVWYMMYVPTDIDSSWYTHSFRGGGGGGGLPFKGVGALNFIWRGHPHSFAGGRGFYPQCIYYLVTYINHQSLFTHFKGGALTCIWVGALISICWGGDNTGGTHSPAVFLAFGATWWSWHPMAFLSLTSLSFISNLL